MSWKFVDEAEPPRGKDLLVWNGAHASVAKLKRGRFVAQAEGGDVMDPWERPLVIKGVTHWDLARPPR
jgi:hypothetical protein